MRAPTPIHDSIADRITDWVMDTSCAGCQLIEDLVDFLCRAPGLKWVLFVAIALVLLPLGLAAGAIERVQRWMQRWKGSE